MKYHLSKSITLILLSLLTFLCRAQQITFSHYTLDKNLPAQTLMQDSKGYLWIGSDGLFKFDGVDATHFVNDPKVPNSLANNSIKSITEDKNGTIWIGTLNGISHYNPSTNTFNNYRHIDNNNNSLITNLDNIVFIDHASTVWIGNREGISKFDRDKKIFTHYDLAKYQQAGRIKGKFITSIIDDKTNANWLWLGSYDGLIHFRKSDGFCVYYYPANIPVTITKILQDSYNKLWICSWGLGIGTFNAQTTSFSFTTFEQDEHLGISNIVNDIVEKKLNATTSFFYLSTNIGLTTFTLNEADNTSHIDLTNFLVNNPQQSTSIGGPPNSILLDKQGIVWVSTEKDISYILPNNQVFKSHYLQLGDINNLLEDRTADNKLFYWVSSWYNGGLTICDSSLTNVTKADLFNALMHSKDGTQINTSIITNNQLWVGTMDGLFMYDKITKQRKAFFKDSTVASLPSNRVYALYADHHNRLWIGTYNNGIALLDLSTQKFLPIPSSLQKQTEGKKVSVIYEDSKGNIWMNDNADILKIKTSDLTFKTYTHIQNDLHSKSNGEITTIIEDKQQRIWMSSREGLNMYNSASDNFSLISTTDGLSNNNIVSLALDQQNNLWIATTKGLNCLNTKSFKIKSYYTENGIERDGNLNYLLLNSNGQLMIGGTDLLTTFCPASLIKNATAAPIYINKVSIINKEKKLIINDSVKQVELNYDENYFTIDFIALNLINASQNKYAYKLEGLDNDYINAGNTHKAVYTNISSGTYIFKVKASNNDDVWNNKGAYIIIKIKPPFWKTWWFISLCALLSLLIVYAIYRYRVEQLLQVERLRTKISTDLHDDIGSTLSSISILSDIVIKQKDDAHANNMLQEIKDNSLNLMEKMDDIVWSINPKNDTLENLMLRIKHFAAQLFEAKNIDYNINISEAIAQLKISMDKRQHLYLIIKESINNIIKHAGCSYVNITASQQHNELVITIEDNGIGFNTADTFSGNGLLSLQNRARLMHARLNIKSAFEKGTIITVHIKIK